MLILDILFYSFIVVVCLQVSLYIFVYGRFAFLKAQKTNPKKISVSVIVCAKNEADNLSQFIPTLVNQDYPDFEIVLINDASNDDTLEVMESFSKKHHNIKIVNVKPVEAFWGNKKYPLTLGIKASKYDFLLFTDADCKPVSKNWIKEMSAHFSNKTDIILGYGAHSKIKNSFLNKLIRYETLITAIQYFSFAKIGIPYMGVGRNLAYKKSAFFNANGFMGHMNVKSGDDDLFINQVATKDNTTICFTENSFTESVSKKSLKTWIKQKRRHISTAKYYKQNHKIILAISYGLNLFFWLLATALLTFTFKWPFVIGILLLRLLVQFIVVGFSSKKLKETDVLILLPLLEIFLVIIQFYIFINNLLAKPNHWK